MCCFTAVRRNSLKNGGALAGHLKQPGASLHASGYVDRDNLELLGRLLSVQLGQAVEGVVIHLLVVLLFFNLVLVLDVVYQSRTSSHY